MFVRKRGINNNEHDSFRVIKQIRSETECKHSIIHDRRLKSLGQILRKKPATAASQEAAPVNHIHP